MYVAFFLWVTFFIQKVKMFIVVLVGLLVHTKILYQNFRRQIIKICIDYWLTDLPQFLLSRYLTKIMYLFFKLQFNKYKVTNQHTF